MKSSTKRLLVILGSFALMVASIYVYFSMILPAYDRIQQLRGERLSKQTLLNTQRSAEQAVNELITQFENLRTFQEIVSLSLPRDADIPVILNQIQGTARLSRVNLQSLSFQYLPLEETRNQLVQPIGVVRVSMVLLGNYEGIKEYISSLETNIRIMDLNSLKIDGGAKLTSDILTYNLVVDVYYQSEEINE